MTETTEQKVKIKVTKHPREMFYEGRSTRDHMNAQVEYLNTSPTIPDLKLIKGFVKKLKVGDIVGVEHNQYRVEEVDHHSFIGENISNKQKKTLTPEDITVALGSGYCEILYRDDKPYGIELEKEVTVKIVNHNKEEETK